MSFFSFIFKKKIPSHSAITTELQKITLRSVIFCVLVAAICTLSYITLWHISRSYTLVTPTYGGTLVEGVVGAPRFINPLLAATPTDEKLVSLIYAGLVSSDGNGNIAPESAHVTQSSDGLTYTFIFDMGAKFSNGDVVTSADAAYTISLIQNGKGSNTLQNGWKNAVIATPDLQTLTVTLPSPVQNFLESATFGILPKKLWNTVTAEDFVNAPYNLTPIGAGNFMLKKITYQNGIPSTVILERNPFAQKKAYLEKYELAVYPSQSALLGALKSRDIDMTTSLPGEALTGQRLRGYTTTQLQSNENISLLATTQDPVLQNPALYQLILSTIDKEALLATIENSYGLVNDPNVSSQSFPSQALQNLLLTKGFARAQNGTLTLQGKPISLSLAVESNSKEASVAQSIATALTNIGLTTSVKAYDHGTFLDITTTGTPTAIITDGTLSVNPAYTLQLPLYTRTVPIIIKTNKKDMFSQVSAPNISLLYHFAEHWFIRTDRIWKWF